MVEILSVVWNSLAISALYALVAIGLTLIFGVGGVLNLAHSGFITLGGFVAYYLTNQQGYPVLLSPLIAFVVGGIVGGVLYVGLVRYIERNVTATMIVSLFVGFIMMHFFRIIHGNQSIQVQPILQGKFSVAGVSIQQNMFAVFVLSWVVIISLLLLMEYTRTGKAIVAVSMSRRGADIVGISYQRMNMYTWIIASSFAAVAGVLLVTFQGGSWFMGINPLILSLSIVIAGGLGSIKGSVVGAYLIGFLETITVTMVNTSYAGFPALIILVVVLLVQPNGLYGREQID